MFSTRKIRAVVISGVAVAAALTLTAGRSAAASGCFAVSGRYAEHAVTGPECLSPVGLCIAGTYRGDITGSLGGSANTITPTADTPTTSVLTFTSDSTIAGAVRGNRGTLIVKNAGVFTTLSDGSIVDLQTIVGGTGNSLGREGLSGPAEPSRPLTAALRTTRDRSAWDAAHALETACPINWCGLSTARSGAAAQAIRLVVSSDHRHLIIGKVSISA